MNSRARASVAIRWRPWARPLVTLRHPILLAFVLLQSWGVRSDADWSLLSNGGKALFSASPLTAYAGNPGLQAGPPALAVVRGLNLLPGEWGEDLAHLLIAFMGWLILFLVERWTVRGSTYWSVPLLPGLMTLAVGLPVLQEWTALAGALPHIEDGLALLTLVLAARAITRGRVEWSGVLVGLTIAWKPWAVIALPMVWGLPRRGRALLLAVAIPAACWLPFVLGDGGTLKAVSDGFILRANSPLREFGLSGLEVPNWWRDVELLGALAAASLAAVRRDWRTAFAAGCATRLLLDPAGFDYYVAGLIMATAASERLAGLRPWRTALLLASMVYAGPWLSWHGVVVVRFSVLSFVVISWLHPWAMPDRIRRGVRGRFVLSPGVVPAPRTAPAEPFAAAIAQVGAQRRRAFGPALPPKE